MVKRKNEQIFDEDEEQFNSNVATEYEIAARKKHTPTLGTPEKVGREEGRLRKKTRTKLYNENVMDLNKKFAQWTKDEEQRICAKIESGELTASSSPMMYEPDVMLYIKKMVDIKEKYQPKTGDVLTFGSGDFGQLGHKDREGDNDCDTPRCIMSVRNSGVTSISCGGLHSIAVRDNGEVLAWGANDEGALGIVDVVTTYTPLPVKGFIPSQYEVAKGLEIVDTWKNVIGRNLTNPKIVDSKYDEKIVLAKAGDCHSLCLSSTGRVYFFGVYKDKDGKSWRDMPPKDDPRIFIKKEEEIDPDFVSDDAKKQEGAERPKEAPKPPKISKPDIPPVGQQAFPSHVCQIDGEVVSIDCGGSFNAAIVEKKDEITSQYTRTCVTWGIGECGELARPIATPVKDKHHVFVEGEPKLADYAMDAIRDEYLMPKPVVWCDSIDKRRVESISCGGFHLLVTSRNLMNGSFSVHSSGLNNYGQLGLDKEFYNKETKKYLDVDNLTEIKAFNGRNIIQVSAGLHHSLALESNGSLYAFGRGDYGQLGNTDGQPAPGHLVDVPVPICLVEGKANPIISEIAAGANQNIVLTGDGDVYSWGYGDTGSLGHGVDFDENGQCLQVSDEFRPRKMDVLKQINVKRKQKGKSPMTAKVHHVTSGSQHSAIISSLLE